MGNLTIIWNNFFSIDFGEVLLIIPTMFAIGSTIFVEKKNPRNLIFVALISISVAIIYTGIGNINSLVSEMVFAAKLLSTAWFTITIFILVLALISSGKSQETKDSEGEKNDR